MLYPFLIIYFTHTLKLGIAEAGFLLSVRFVASGFLGFLGGMLADRIGLARTYLLAGWVTGVTLFVMGDVRSIPVLVILLGVLGVAASTVNAMARGLLNQAVNEDGRGLAQNYVHWLNNVGMAAALPLSAFLLGGGYSVVPFDVSAAVYILMALFVGGAFQGGTPPVSGVKSLRDSTPWTVLRDDPALRWLLCCFLLVVLVEMQFESGVPLDLAFHFHRGARLYGILGVLDMALVVILQLLIRPALNQKRTPWYVLLGMLAVGGLIIGGLWQSVTGWTVSIVLLGIGDVMAYGRIFYWMGGLPKPGRQGAYFSLLGMVQGVATFLAYSLGADLYQTLRAGWMFGLTLPVTVIAVLAYRRAETLALQASATSPKVPG